MSAPVAPPAQPELETLRPFARLSNRSGLPPASDGSLGH